MQRIILIGFMGSGKTHIGKQLAIHLNIPFFDSDELISQRLQMHITTIFNVRGEEYFRDLERDFIHEFNYDDDFVLSVGGGLPCHSNLISKLNMLGTTIFLNCSLETLHNRLLSEKNTRPLIRNTPKNELFDFIKTILETRNPVYLQSQIILPEDKHTVEKIIHEIRRIS